MELMMIITGEEHAEKISSLLVNNDYRATEIGSNGEFLQYGDTVLLLGVESEEVDKVVSLLKKNDKDKLGKNSIYKNEVSIFVMSAGRYLKIKP